MPNSLVISAARCRLYVNNVIYSVTQEVSVSQDTGEHPVYGINSPYPQEIGCGGQNVVKGSAKVVRTSNSGGVQAINLRPLFSDLGASNYVSLLLQDRQTGETLWSIPKAKISNIVESVSARGIYQTSFQFVGMIMFWPLDLS